MNIHWKVSSLNENEHYNCTLTLVNNSTEVMEADEWALYFNQIPGAEFAHNGVNPFNVERISGGYFRLTPQAGFASILPGDSLSIDYLYPGDLKRVSYVPNGFHWVKSGKVIWEGHGEIHYFPEGYPKSWEDDDRFPTAERIFAMNAERGSFTTADIPKLIPQPLNMTSNGTRFSAREVKIWNEKEYANEAIKLGEKLSLFFSGSVQVVSDRSKANIILEKDLTVEDIEGYSLQVESELIHIKSHSAAGMFYGTQTLVGLLPFSSEKYEVLELDGVDITDRPRYHYRGLHLDMARNFKSKEGLFKIIDLMAYYKLNKLNLQVSDDEGWRLEIDELPELTELASKRGYTTDESDKIFPYYGSGASGTLTGGNGYYSTEDFIEILQYAKERHIEVVVKLDFPGHARAAIQAMEKRYDSLMEAGMAEAAEEYLLIDHEDQSKYNSVQDYNDNVVCVCRESLYRFIETVVDDIIEKYKMADVPLNIIHIGGDEVPDGVWEESPLCNEWLEQQGKEEDAKNELFSYFVERVNAILSERDLITAGWEEIVQTESEEGRVPNTEFLDHRFLPYVWHKNYAYPLVNAGYKIILCNAENLYFDLAYDYYPAEPGLTWAGTVNTYDAFMLEPELLYPETPDSLMNPENIMGVQGQLWGETVWNDERMEYYLFPKLIGLSATAWMIPDAKSNLSISWNQFANAVGQRELRRLDILADGLNYRLPRPGVILTEAQKVDINTMYPSLSIRYTVDGTEPTLSSPEFSGPFDWNEGMEIRAITVLNGKKSQITLWKK